MDKTTIIIIALSAIFGVTFCITPDDITGDVGFARDFEVGTLNFFGNAWNVPVSSGCCEACAKQLPKRRTQLYIYTNTMKFCICADPRETANVKTKSAQNATFSGICDTPPEALALTADRKKCEEGDNEEITCCPTLTTGDNASDKLEKFVQERELKSGGCQQTCQEKYPDSIGMTESKSETYPNGKKKCWCEFGESKLSADTNYQTCLF